MTKIELEQFNTNDFSDFFELISDPSIKSAGFPQNLTENVARAMFNEIVNNPWYNKILYNNKFVGLLFLNQRGQSKDLVNTRELGFAIDKNYRNKGIVTDAVELAIVYSKKLNITELWASTTKQNEASKKVLLKNGFEYKYEADMSILGLQNQQYYMKKL
ncbi:GNAT family N-acetyltransferase [Companilactobacillus sp. DQM5]|uniref:GNAT family N-acetyltransferase n=1 Tax=Companilactobacillus sp. DQM5 TaxID=3463359 RepID=UPI0040593CB0